MAATVATSVASLCTAFRAQASVSRASPSALTCRAGPVRRSVLSRGTSSPAACRPVSRALGFSSAVAGQKVELSSSAPAAAAAAASRTLAVRAKAGYKMKTHKASAKRFRVTGSGKVVRRNAWRAHLLRKKSTKRKNRLAGMSDVFRGDLDKVIGAMPYLKVNRNRTP